MPLEEVVELLRFVGRRRERELGERRLIESLTPREREILQLLAAGLDSVAIARQLHISPRTQRTTWGTSSRSSGCIRSCRRWYSA